MHSLIAGATLSIKVTHISHKGNDIGFDRGEYEILSKRNKTVQAPRKKFSSSPLLITSAETLAIGGICTLRIYLYKGNFVSIGDLDLEVKT